METKGIILKILASSILFLLVGLLFALPQKFWLCAGNDWVCISSLSGNIGEPLTLFMALFIPSALLVFAFRNIVYQAWKKFALFYIPLSVILIALVPVSCGGNFISFFCLNKENTSWLTAGGFFIITIILIITKKIKAKSNQGL